MKIILIFFRAIFFKTLKSTPFDDPSSRLRTPEVLDGNIEASPPTSIYIYYCGNNFHYFHFLLLNNCEIYWKLLLRPPG